MKNVFDKSKSVKCLKRHSAPEKSMLFESTAYCFRGYLSVSSIEGATEENFNQANKSSDQIYAFAVFGEENLNKETIEEKVENHIKEYKEFSPNLMLSLNGSLMIFLNAAKNCVADSYLDADTFVLTKNRLTNFEFLLTKIQQRIHGGRTVPVNAYTRYLSLDDTVSLDGAITFDIAKIELPDNILITNNI